ncbi:MAG: cell division site-positioning protein MapZ family protein [Streptococcus sp.]|nr:cell division site-positioning protein MapZ family protein [Streptococcus sp.]
MSKKEKNSSKQEEKESILEFEEAKEMTIGQANRKKEELEAGVTETDNVLDKYIKQHREEIDAGKFETQKIKKIEVEQETENTNSDLADFIKEKREEVEGRPSAVTEESSNVVTPEENKNIPEDSTPQVEQEDEQATKEIPNLSRSNRSSEIDIVPEVPVKKTSYGPTQDFEDDEEELSTEKTPFYKKKVLLYSLLGLIGIAVVSTATYFAFENNKNHKTVSSSSTSASKSSKKTSSSSSSKTDNLKDFNTLYDSFFTDSSQTAIKNSSFSDLEKLKTALEKLKGTSDYDAAKTKYDALVKQISAIQSVNSQFDGGAITDGVLNKEAKANKNATFNDVTTGNSKLDAVLKEAIEQGRSQQVATPAPATDQATTSGNTGANNNAASSTTTPNSPSVTYSGYGLSSEGVNLQRNLSRVPYDQTKINDVNNAAWTFNPGVLEKVLETSRKRGYISGDNYILERVNIINGNGYYNLFKPDGTYLFSINCKTGYFVGNGSGYSDSLDF